MERMFNMIGRIYIPGSYGKHRSQSRDEPKVVRNFQRPNNPNIREQQLIEDGFIIMDHEVKVLNDEDWQMLINDVKTFDQRDVRMSILLGKLKFKSRRDLWNKIMFKVQQMNGDLQFEKLAAKQNKYSIEIQQNIKEAIIKHEYYRDPAHQRALARVLQAYSNFDPQLGFRKEMLHIVGNIMYCYDIAQNDDMLEDTEIIDQDCSKHIFYLLVEIMVNKGWAKYFLDGMPGLIQSLHILEGLIKQYLPEFHTRMNYLNMDIQLIFRQYYLGLMMENSPKQFNEIILTLVLLEGEQIIHRITIGMLRLYAKDILRMGSKEFQKFVTTRMTEHFCELLNGKNPLNQLKNIGLVQNSPIQLRVAPLPPPQKVNFMTKFKF